MLRASCGRLFLSLVALIPCLIVACTVTRVPRRLGIDEPHLKVVTYNVNHQLEGNREILAAIRQGDGDVVVLQEVTPGWERALRATLPSVYPHMVFHHWPDGGGLGFLSRAAIRPRGHIKPVDGGCHPAWLVTLETAIGEIQVLNVHLCPPVNISANPRDGYWLTEEIRLQEIRHVASFLDPSLPSLIAGTLNEDSRGAAYRHLARGGVRSALDDFDPAQHTWRWLAPVGSTTAAFNEPLYPSALGPTKPTARWSSHTGTITAKLDHILYDSRLEPVDARVLTAGASDHLPVVGVFVRKQ